jgi:hypothetical protein
MNRAARLVAGVALAAAFLPLPALAQARMPTYEPQQRLRTALDTCLKTEVMREAYCVKKCATGFRMDLSGKKPMCIGLKQDATYTPPKPSYQPPPPAAPGARPPAGGLG